MAIGTLTALGALASGGLGAAKSAQKQAAKDKATQLAAETARYSPWTNMDPNAALKQAQGMEGANFLGDVMGGGVAGALSGKSADEAGGWENLFSKKEPSPASTMTAYEPSNMEYDPTKDLSLQTKFNKKNQGFSPFNA